MIQTVKIGNVLVQEEQTSIYQLMSLDPNGLSIKL